MQLGFVIDHSRCIGCHACTVACKAENDVPLGKFRTWVKYVEEGQFPQVRRHFAVLRCNQCTSAPCVHICPTGALAKRPDGIVDVDPDLCIGCKSCMQACPYDALYIDEESGTAEKCHFCAHRVEVGLAPACAVVCPTEAIIPGDFHDPQSRVSQLRAGGGLAARKTEAGTGPNVFYKQAHPAGLDPALANAAGGYLWAQQLPGPQLDAQRFEALLADAERRAGDSEAPAATARTVLDVPRKQLWGGFITGYLFAKSIAAGLFLAGMLWLPPFGQGLPGRAGAWIPLLALIALGATMGLLVGDLKRPDRFLLVLRHPNWRSWLAKGAVIISLYAAALVAWGLWLVFGGGVGGFWGGAVALVTAVLAGLTAVYTAWLFGQAKGRALWLKRGLWLSLLAHAGIAGAATLMLLHPLFGLQGWPVESIERLLTLSLVVHGALTLLEARLAPAGRRVEYERAVRLITDGPYALGHIWVGLGLGLVMPLVLLIGFDDSPTMWWIAAAGALAGLWVEEDTFVRAGQAIPIS